MYFNANDSYIKGTHESHWMMRPMVQLSTKIGSRLRIVIILAVVVIVIVSGSVAMGLIRSEDSGTPSAHATVDHDVARVGETLHFSSEGTDGNIKIYFWEFGDGNSSTEPETSHSYERPGFYNVTLTVFDKDDHTDDAVLRVGIQLPDLHETREDGRYIDIRPRYNVGYSVNGMIGPNIGKPTIDVQIHISRPVGTFRLAVLGAYLTDDDVIVFTIQSQNVTATGADIDLSITVEPVDLPDETCSADSIIEAGVNIDQGMFNSIQITIVGIFPTEGMEGQQ
jgi:hypothetical protein